jgi:hypothetical protein
MSANSHLCGSFKSCDKGHFLLGVSLDSPLPRPVTEVIALAMSVPAY